MPGRKNHRRFGFERSEAERGRLGHAREWSTADRGMAEGRARRTVAWSKAERSGQGHGRRQSAADSGMVEGRAQRTGARAACRGSLIAREEKSPQVRIRTVGGGARQDGAWWFQAVICCPGWVMRRLFPPPELF